jgi:hypothetical protein
MGAESFFIKVLPSNLTVERKADKELTINLNENIMFNHVIGNDKSFNIDWYSMFKNKNFQVVKIHADKFIFAESVEFNICKNKENSTYIDLIGSFSCFNISVGVMEKILENMNNIVETEVYYYICGNIHKFDSNYFYRVVTTEYNIRYENFKEIFPDAKFIVRPSKFYKEYYGIIPSLKRKIKKIFYGAKGRGC